MGNDHSRVSPRERSYSSGEDTVQRPIIYIEANELAYFSDEDVDDIQKSINEMAICRGIFDSWAAELAEWVFCFLPYTNPSCDRLRRNPPQKRRELHKNVKSQISSLQDDAESALGAADNIVKSLQSFSRLMIRRLQEAKDNNGVVESVPQIEQTATRIQAYSGELSRHVERMCEDWCARWRSSRCRKGRLWGNGFGGGLRLCLRSLAGYFPLLPNSSLLLG